MSNFFSIYSRHYFNVKQCYTKFFEFGGSHTNNSPKRGLGYDRKSVDFKLFPFYVELLSSAFPLLPTIVTKYTSDATYLLLSKWHLSFVLFEK
jgi:hypothetical protein